MFLEISPLGSIIIRNSERISIVYYAYGFSIREKNIDELINMRDVTFSKNDDVIGHVVDDVIGHVVDDVIGHVVDDVIVVQKGGLAKWMTLVESVRYAMCEIEMR
jgi:rRNA processing protein Gar1